MAVEPVVGDRRSDRGDLLEVKAILEGGNAIQIAEAARRAGVRNLRQSALMKVKQGVTSFAEIDRVTKD